MNWLSWISRKGFRKFIFCLPVNVLIQKNTLKNSFSIKFNTLVSKIHAECIKTAEVRTYMMMYICKCKRFDDF